MIPEKKTNRMGHLFDCSALWGTRMKEIIEEFGVALVQTAFAVGMSAMFFSAILLFT